MVAAADLRGYLVMPQSTPAPGTLLLVETIDASWRDTADTMAVGGEVVFLLPTTVDTARGEQYLTHLAATRGIRTLCKRTDCP